MSIISVSYQCDFIRLELQLHTRISELVPNKILTLAILLISFQDALKVAQEFRDPSFAEVFRFPKRLIFLVFIILPVASDLVRHISYQIFSDSHIAVHTNDGPIG